MHKIDNDGFHIQAIVDSVQCSKHRASLGHACWLVYIPSIKTTRPAVCGRRIKRAGFVGKISPSSLSQKSSGVRRRA